MTLLEWFIEKVKNNSKSLLVFEHYQIQSARIGSCMVNHMAYLQRLDRNDGGPYADEYVMKSGLAIALEFAFII